MKCPKCGRKNPDDIWHCDCGYDFHPSLNSPSRAAPTPAASSLPPQSFLFAKIYACFCFLACIIAGYFAVMALLRIVEVGDWMNNTATQWSAGLLVAMILMIALWSATGVAILRRKKFAITLSYIGAVVAVLGILARGIIPLEIVLAIPTFAIIGYLRKRSALLS